MKAIAVFVLVFGMGLLLRFVPSSNWVWWLDVSWIALIALGSAAATLDTKGQNNER